MKLELLGEPIRAVGDTVELLDVAHPAVANIDDLLVDP